VDQHDGEFYRYDTQTNTFTQMTSRPPSGSMAGKAHDDQHEPHGLGIMLSEGKIVDFAAVVSPPAQRVRV